MTDALFHRGPDGEGFFSRNHVVLGHRRLKIIDLSDAAKQPIADSAGAAVITYNGEIYNYKELRATLSARGHRFASHGDSETIPVAYSEWGDAFLEHLHGMFAFALYDTRSRRLLLARDRIGIKPLYIVRQPHFVAFASEIKAFIAAGLIRPHPNPAAIAEYIQRGYHQGGHSWYEEVYELPPGHYATISPGGDFKVEAFWKLPDPSTQMGADPHVALRAALGRAASSHLQSDVPLGAHLSGGIDSSAVVALLSERLPERLHTFSVYFDEGGWYDERPYIEEVSRRYGTVHHYTVPTWRDAQASLPGIVAALDEPVAGPGVIPQYLLNKDIRAHGVIVANGGQGGDEMFGGYARHLLPYALGELASKDVDGWRNGFSAVRTLGLSGLLRFAGERIFVPGTMLLHPDLRSQVRPFRHGLRFEQLLHQDLTGYLHSLLQVEDRTSMAASVESRVPLLDDEVIELAASMHRRWKLRGGIPKRVLRDAVRDLLPTKVLRRQDKRGLPTPIGLWIRGPLKDWVHSVLSDPMVRAEMILDASRVERLLQIHCTGTADLSGPLWRALTLGIWLQNVRSLRSAGEFAVGVGAAAHASLATNQIAVREG